MTCAEFQELLAAHALGALEPDEAAAVEAHLAQPGHHEGCAEALARARATAGLLARAVPPVRPRERVWRGIAEELRLSPEPSSRPSGSRGSLPWIAAASVLLLAGLALDRNRIIDDRNQARARVAQSQGELSRLRDEVGKSRAAAGLERARCDADIKLARADQVLQREAVALLEHPGTKVVAMNPAGPRKLSAVAIVNGDRRRAFVMGSALPTQPGKDYELWVLRGSGAPLRAGQMRPVGNGVLLGEVDPTLLGTPPDALAVSIEVAGGVDAPTDVELVGKLSG